MSFDDFYAEYISNKPKVSELEKKFREVMQACFKQAPNLKKVAYTGYTPSWNDGEPCEHWQDVSFLGENFIDDGYEVFLDELTDSELSSLKSGTGPLDKRVKKLLLKQPLTEQVWGTNYRIIVSREEDGSIKIDADDYYCDY